jgi:diadenylate cyclase
LNDRLMQLYDAATTRDMVEIGILAVTIYLVLRFLGKTRGAGMVRGLGLVVIGLFLLAQVFIASFDLTVLGRVLDYLLTTVLFGLLVIFQPELRRGLIVLGRYRPLRYFVQDRPYPVADKLADAAEALARECVGALIAIEREMTLAAYVETGEFIDGEVSAMLLRSIFCAASSASAARCTTGRSSSARAASPRPPASCRWASCRRAPRCTWACGTGRRCA